MFTRACCVVLVGMAVVGAPRGSAQEGGQGVPRWAGVLARARSRQQGDGARRRDNRGARLADRSVQPRRLVLFNLEKGTIVADREFPKGRVGWMLRSGLLFVRSPENTLALSLETLQPVHEFGAETGVPEDALKEDLGIVTHQPGRRFVMTTTAGVKMFDYDFKHVGTVEGLTRVDGLYRTGPLASEPQNER